MASQDLRFGKIKYKNGEKYIGFYRNGSSNSNKIIKEGFGQVQLTNNSICIGDFKNNKIHGLSIFYYPNGNYIFGYFKDNKKDGLGLVKEHTQIYKGYFRKDKAKGFGQKETEQFEITGEIELSCLKGFGQIYELNEKISFRGTYFQGKMQGFGVQQGDVQYIGEWRESVPHGKGQKIYHDGTSYLGEFRHGEQTGSAIISSSEETMFGNVKKGQLQGLAQITSKNGDILIGEFRDGLLNGFGKTGNQHYTYIGEYSSGLQHGVGVLIKPEHQEYYVGEFRKGKMAGSGYLRVRSSIYQGAFDNDKRNGPGIYQYKTQTKVIALFKNDNVVQGVEISEKKVDQTYDNKKLIQLKKEYEEKIDKMYEKVQLQNEEVKMIPTEPTNEFQMKDLEFTTKKDKLIKDIKDMNLEFRVKLQRFQNNAKDKNIQLFDWTTHFSNLKQDMKKGDNSHNKVNPMFMNGGNGNKNLDNSFILAGAGSENSFENGFQEKSFTGVNHSFGPISDSQTGNSLSQSKMKYDITDIREDNEEDWDEGSQNSNNNATSSMKDNRVNSELGSKNGNYTRLFRTRNKMKSDVKKMRAKSPFRIPKKYENKRNQNKNKSSQKKGDSPNKNDFNSNKNTIQNNAISNSFNSHSPSNFQMNPHSNSGGGSNEELSEFDRFNKMSKIPFSSDTNKAKTTTTGNVNETKTSVSNSNDSEFHDKSQNSNSGAENSPHSNKRSPDSYKNYSSPNKFSYLDSPNTKDLPEYSSNPYKGGPLDITLTTFGTELRDVVEYIDDPKVKNYYKWKMGQQKGDLTLNKRGKSYQIHLVDLF